MTDITSTGIKWQEPAPPAGGKGRPNPLTPEIKAELVANPGRWALLIDRGHSAHADRWKKKFGPDGFEFTTRAVRGARPIRFEVYGRYVGEASA